MVTRSYVYSRGQSVNFMVDALIANLKEVILENNLDPTSLVMGSDVIKRGLRTWIESGDLKMVVIEFFPPGSGTVTARWDFPISYSGSGVQDDMWTDKSYLRGIIAKSARPKQSDEYRVVLITEPGREDVDGFSPCEMKATGGLTSTGASTVISTGHLTASTIYWR